ncbi:GNAT family N-acetyltransferase [Aerophototrophica crusticola]|uniref:GNAT family N-acetyltransferase n=1 Tax=Aerophototrophica crusticola TaxID=1709002 RepID=A0A858RBC6_9PROT|nr:GNAT family N-acetyltransferase [Rhodospirillaceae bacterium B3]
MEATTPPIPARPLPPGITLRATRVTDAEAINAMANLPRFRWGTLRVPFPSLEGTRRWLEGKNPDDTSIVACAGDQVVGCADLARGKGRRAHAAMLGIGVHDDFAGRGIGSALMAALLDTADNWLDIRRVELHVFADNEPAIALYRKFGFTDEGRCRAYAFRDGRYVDCLAMGRVRV